MCGIIGYTGSDNAVPKIVEGLSVLEYRGYDSVGIAAEANGKISTVKCRGRINALEEKLVDSPIEGSTCAIGHTRWATHGGPSDINAHPHRIGNVVLVHNGIIENYKELKSELANKGVSFVSETDTEVAAALISDLFNSEKDPFKAIKTATTRLVGSYAFGILFDVINFMPLETQLSLSGLTSALSWISSLLYFATDILSYFFKKIQATSPDFIKSLPPTSSPPKIILSNLQSARISLSLSLKM